MKANSISLLKKRNDGKKSFFEFEIGKKSFIQEVEFDVKVTMVHSKWHWILRRNSKEKRLESKDDAGQGKYVKCKSLSVTTELSHSLKPVSWIICDMHSQLTEKPYWALENENM